MSQQVIEGLVSEVKSVVSASTEEFKTKFSALQTQVDSIDKKLAGGIPIATAGAGPSYAKALEESETLQRLIRDRRGSAVITFSGKCASDILQRKSVITETVSGSIGSDTGSAVGVATTGVLQIDRIPGITPEARQVLRVRDVLYQRPTTFAVVDFVKVSTPMSQASPVAEGSIKPENNLTFSSSSERIKTIATWIPASRQVLDDMQELRGFLDSSLGYYVNLAEENQLLSGDNSGEDLHGLIPQAAAFNTGLLPSAAKGWTKLDVIGCAIKQIDAAKEIAPTFVIMHVNDWWDVRLTKDGFGRYILGDPQSQVRPSIFGLDIVPTTSIAPGTFLVGSGNPVASEIRDRMELVVEISTEHQDYFIRNLIAVRAEKRLALVVKRANSYVSGTFTTSP